MKSPVVGIDVGKYELVIYLNGSCYTVNNELDALKQWIKNHSIALKEVDLIVYEPTGGYERTLRCAWSRTICLIAGCMRIM